MSASAVEREALLVTGTSIGMRLVRSATCADMAPIMTAPCLSVPVVDQRGMVLTFNVLLRQAGIDPAGVRLLRHRDPVVQRQVYAAALDRDPRFELYQRSQCEPRIIDAFESADHVAAFVVDHAGECVFAGVWQMLGRSTEPYRDAFDGVLPPSRSPVMFDMSRLEGLDLYRGRLVIEWGAGQRAWVQRADRQDKPILELRRQITEPVFPGFGAFRCCLSEVETLPSTWLAALRSIGGVYLLVHRTRADIYIGSASGEEGFFGRWRSYSNGHGGNVGMQEIEGRAEDYDVSILETAGSGLDERAILALEALWKDKLGSRSHGLNRN